VNAPPEPERDLGAEPEIVDDPDRSRYELRLDGRVAVVADYRRHGDQLSFTHTGTDPRLRNRGLAARLIEQALTEAKRGGDEVLPYCSFVSDYIASHDEYLELVPAGRRSEFGLPAGD
jgi:predicted GNAT family acetyltransferase